MDSSVKDEWIVLESMFPDAPRSHNHLELTFEFGTLILDLPAQYPDSAPDYSLNLKFPLSKDHSIHDDLSHIFVPGQIVIYDWIEHLERVLMPLYTLWKENQRSNLVEEQEGEPSDGSPSLPLLNHHDQADYVLPPACPLIHHSTAPLINKKSVFVAHAAIVENSNDIALVKTALLSNKKVSKATHNITAFRFVDVNTGVLKQECDDDGETAAGGRLLHMLQSADCRGVFVMVSRWYCAYSKKKLMHRYGGVQLGPQRFKDINNCARQLLEERGLLPDRSKTKKKS